MVTKHSNQSRLKVALLVFICACFWGLSFYTTKIALAAGISEMELLSIRWTIGAIAFVSMTLLGVVKVNFKGKSIKTAIYVAMFQPCFYFMGYISPVSCASARDNKTTRYAGARRRLYPKTLPFGTIQVVQALL